MASRGHKGVRVKWGYRTVESFLLGPHMVTEHCFLVWFRHVYNKHIWKRHRRLAITSQRDTSHLPSGVVTLFFLANTFEPGTSPSESPVATLIKEPHPRAHTTTIVTFSHCKVKLQRPK